MMTIQQAAALECVNGEDAVLEEVRGEASIDDLMAEIAVTQRYRNPGDAPIEAVYTFPVPVDGVLLRFEVEIGDRRLAGVVVGKAEGERRYEEALTGGDAAVLLEEAGPGLYTASVGNLLPGETATIRFRYGLLLRWNGDRVRFAMPTTIAPRYGDPAAAGLAPHQEPRYVFDATRAFGLAVSVRGLLRGARFNSPSHDIRVATTAGATMVTLTGAPAMDRDFVLEARSSRSDVTGAISARDFDGWVALASFRPAIPAAGHAEPRSVKIVVDCSGSMAGPSIAQAREALERILDSLQANDLFEIIAFGNDQRTLFGRETPVSETTLAQARRFVRALDADMGGTEIQAALETAYRLRSDAGLQRDLLLITDGQAWRSDEAVAEAGRSGHRVFTVGVGHAVAEAFVRSLAGATGGACELVAPREDMAERIHRHFQRMYAPRARSAAVRWPAEVVRSLPESLDTVYGGDTLHVFAWFTEKPEGAARLEVTLADGRVVSEESPILAVPGDSADTPPSEDAMPSAMARLGASRRMVAMDDEDEAGFTLALRYQLLSRWTNCIVTHVRADGEKAEGLPKIVRVPQVLAHGWHGTGMRLAQDTIYSSTFMPRIHDAGLAEMESYAVSPAELVERLNARPIPPFPSLRELRAWGVPQEILAALLRLVGQGESETAVVVTFLYRLANSPAGKGLDGRVQTRILNTHQTNQLGETVVDVVNRAFDDWEARSITEGSAP